MYNKISGEYWIHDGSIDYADGNHGDMNHEMIAFQHIVQNYLSNLIDLANELGINTNGIDEYEVTNDPSIASKLLTSIIEYLKSQNQQNVDKYIMNQISARSDVYKILQEKGDPTLYVMKYEGWIAVRSMNIELFNFNKLKKSLLNGLDEILEQEGFDEQIPPEEIEFALFDLATNQQSSITLADIEAPEQLVKPNSRPGVVQMGLTTKGHSQFNDPTDEVENLKNKNKSVPNNWNQNAQKLGLVGPGQQQWRGTSESFSFKNWLNKKA